MNLTFRKVLAMLLVLAISVLPIPSAFAVSMDMSDTVSADHCKQAMMDHSNHAMSMDVSADGRADSQAEKNTHACQCCGQCDGDCTGCTTVSAITLDLLILDKLVNREIYSSPIVLLVSRNTSPPSRPPLSL